MFSYHNRQYIFRQASGELWNFYCDSKQNLCYSTLTRRGIWSNAVVLHKNAYPYFYSDMDQEEIFHLLFQDNDGNINYSRLDGQSIKTVPVLNTKTPSAYNKHLFMAPFKNNVHFFYVLQHENSFMLGYQVLSNNKISNPRVIDYVSGSSLPCVILYDKTQNIYAFYQSYDGKYLQLGYKKFTLAQKHWSDFTPVTKFIGNCEYPHAIIDDSGIIHLCYQRRAQKLFEMVYQQKAPDKNLWTPEVIVHSSVHSFENASILQMNNNIVVYWVREEIVYYNTGSQAGNNWSKPSRLNFPAGRQLQCLSYKSNSPREEGDPSLLPPAIYPGNLSNGLRLAFIAGDNTGDSSQLHIGDSSQLFARSREGDSSAGSDIKNLVLDTFKQLQGSLDEARAGWSTTKDELAKLTNAYDELNRELGKYTIRLSMLENQLGNAKKLSSRLDALNNEVMALKVPEELKKTKYSETALEAKVSNAVNKNKSMEKAGEIIGTVEPVKIVEPAEPSESVETVKPNKPVKPVVPAVRKSAQKTALSLEPDKLKEWQEWKEPKEWQEGSE